MKFVNALNKPPLKLSLSYQGLSMYIESANQQWRKSAPPIQSTSQCELNGTRLCGHAQKTIPLAPIHPFTKQMVPSLCPESLSRSLSQSSSPVLCKRPIKCFLPSIKLLYARRLFFFVSFIFIAHFRGLAGACVNPRSFFQTLLFVHSLLCQITHSFLIWILAKLVSALPLYLRIILISA